jgi:hypothetical protein
MDSLKMCLTQFRHRGPRRARYKGGLVLRVRTIGPSELFLGQIFDFFCENQFSPEMRATGTSFWGNPRSNSPWKQAILEIGLTLLLGSDSCPPDAHTNTHNNNSYLVRDSVACANQNCVLQLRCFRMRRTCFENHPMKGNMPIFAIMVMLLLSSF